MSGIVPVQVPGYPTSNRVPGAFAVVDATKANTAQPNLVTLIIGQMLGAGTATPNTAVLSAGVGDAIVSFGAGSQLALSVERYRALDTFGTVWCLPLADAGVVLNTNAVQGSPSVTLSFAPGTLGDVLVGEPVTGTGVAGSTTVAAINDATGAVTLSAPTSSAVASGAPITFGGSSPATATITYTGTATGNGTVPLYVNGVYVPVNVNSGDTATVVATNTAAAMNAHASPAGNPLSYSAGSSSGVVTLTSRNNGTLGNQGTIMMSYRGTANGEGQFGTANVPGILATVSAFSGGATDPSLTNALANLPQQSFDFICVPYNDSNSLSSIASFLGDTAGRWNWSSELFGGAFTAKNGTFSARTTWGTGQNSQHITGIGALGSPNPDWHWAVDYCAAAAVSLRANPAVPVGGLGGGVALNVKPPLLANRDVFNEQNTLLYDGISTYVVDQSGVVRVQRAITTYQKNPGGALDNSYLNINVPYQLAEFIRAWRSMILSQFNQAVLLQDGSVIPPGLSAVTPSTIKFATIALYNAFCNAARMQDPKGFAQDIMSTNAGGGLVTMLLPVRLANQLIAVAADVQFTQP